MIIHYGERFSFPDFIMSVIEILENLNEDYELEIDGEKVSFDVIIKYIKRLEKDIVDLNEIVKIKIANAAIDRETINKLRKKK